MVGFTIFWAVSVPFLFIRPERFKKPFFVSSLGCGAAMLAMMIWALSVAGGVGPVFYKGQDVPSTSRWGGFVDNDGRAEPGHRAEGGRNGERERLLEVRE